MSELARGTPVRTHDALRGVVEAVEGEWVRVRIRALYPRVERVRARDLTVLGAPEAEVVAGESEEEREARRRAAVDHQHGRHEAGCPRVCPWSGRR